MLLANPEFGYALFPLASNSEYVVELKTEISEF
jgi:hypothetical protein